MSHHQRKRTLTLRPSKRSPLLWMSTSRCLPHTISVPPPIVPCSVGLPPELMQIIFRYATAPPDGYERSLWQSEYVPFQDSGWHEKVYQARRVRERRVIWQMKSTLALVCQSWYRLAVEFLHEELKLRPNLPYPLEGVLMRYGHWVRRIEIQSQPSDYPSLRLVDILRYCPRLQVLAKRSPAPEDESYFLSGLNGLEPDGLHSLTRLDWAEDGVSSMSRQAFVAIITAAPNLSHLNSNLSVHIQLPTGQKTLRSLRTLRLPILASPITLWSAFPDSPSLTNFVVNDFFLRSIFARPLDVALPQVRCIELQDGAGLRWGSLGALFRMCPACAELAISPSHMEGVNLSVELNQYSQIKCLRLYANPFGVLQDLTAWMKTNYQPLVACFPAVEEVVLHGDWRFALHPRVMETLREDLCRRSCVLVFHD